MSNIELPTLYCPNCREFHPHFLKDGEFFICNNCNLHNKEVIIVKNKAEDLHDVYCSTCDKQSSYRRVYSGKHYDYVCNTCDLINVDALSPHNFPPLKTKIGGEWKMKTKEMTVRWLDGYTETFQAVEARAGNDLLRIKLENGERNIPLRQVRWYSKL